MDELHPPLTRWWPPRPSQGSPREPRGRAAHDAPYRARTGRGHTMRPQTPPLDVGHRAATDAVQLQRLRASRCPSSPVKIRCAGTTQADTDLALTVHFLCAWPQRVVRAGTGPGPRRRRRRAAHRDGRCFTARPLADAWDGCRRRCCAPRRATQPPICPPQPPIPRGGVR